MQSEQNRQEIITTPETTPEQELMGGLSIRTDLRAGVSIDDIQGQVSDWWGTLSSSLSLPGIDLPGGE